MTDSEQWTTLGKMESTSRGQEIKARRQRIGMTVSSLAALAKVDRGKLGRFEEGADRPSERWIGGVDRALADFEEVTGHDEPERPPFVRLTVENVYGSRALVVEGAVENLPELEAMVDRIMRRIASEE